MSPQEHYKKAEEIIEKIETFQASIDKRFETGELNFVSPDVIHALSKNVQNSLALAQAHATLATYPEPLSSVFSMSQEAQEKFREDAEQFTEKAREAFEDGISRAKAAYEAFTAPRPVKDTPQA